MTQQGTSGVQMTKLMAGVTYKFRIDPTSSLPAGGTWTCDFGSINQVGDYTAPGFMPPHGQANITYSAPNGDAACLDVLIAPNPALPASGFPAYIRIPSGFMSPTNTEGNPLAEYISGPSQVATDSGHLVDMVAAHPGVLTLESGEDYPAPRSSSDCKDLAVDTTVLDGGVMQKAATVDAVDIVSSASDSLIVLIPQSMQPAQKPKKCVVWPVNPVPSWNNTNCTGNQERTVDGPVTRKGPFPVPPPQTGTYSFTREAQAHLEALGLGSLGAGFSIGVSYPMTRELQHWFESKKQDVYRCVNGKWKFVRTKSLDRSGFGERTMPNWVAAIDGYPVSGASGNWSPWTKRP